MPHPVGKYEIGKTLGEGTFGKVKRAVNTEDQRVVAIKVLDKDKIQKQNMGSQIKKEISIMKMVKHPHVVELIEVLASKTKIFIVLELVTGGELFDEIVKEGKLCEADGRVYFKQLCNAVMYCHSKGKIKTNNTPTAFSFLVRVGIVDVPLPPTAPCSHVSCPLPHHRPPLPQGSVTVI